VNIALKALISSFTLLWPGWAQSPNLAPVVASYTLNRISAAPGQLITLIAEGINNFDLNPVVRAPAGQDLPYSLGGISVGYEYAFNAVRTPLLEVHPYYGGGCPPDQRSGCGQYNAISIQVPFEAQCSVCGINSASDPYVGIVQGQVPGGRVYVDTFPDQVHILTTCDAFLNPQDYTGMYYTTGLPCPSVVTHGDGSLVSFSSPAHAGEQIVAYAVGLGQTTPPLQTGRLVTASVPTRTTFGLDFNYHPNSLPSKPLPGSPPPVFSGATPGYVGLYQINFTVPPVPQGTRPCVDTTGLFYANVVRSNLTVSVGGDYSFDGARICVAVP
jgi:hypothetical protein